MDVDPYVVRTPERLLTPCLLVYPQIVRSNLLDMLRIAGSTARLRPHVKTHKTPEIVRLGLEVGITRHKCATLAEALMLAEQRVPDVLLAYPQVGPAVGRFSEIVAHFPSTRFAVVVDHPEGVAALHTVFSRHGQRVDVLVDIDCGMGRTGIVPGEGAVQLYRQIADSSALRPAGLHVYDGQNHQPVLAERQAAVTELLKPVWTLIAELRSCGLPVPKLVGGGTPTFPIFAAIDSQARDVDIECSPGTCVLSDHNYGRDYTEMSGIRPAALLLTRVISKPANDRLTVDLGYKAVASDPPAGHRCHFLNLSEATEVQHSEEHLVVQSPQAGEFSIGDVLYTLPAHICPTVALHSHLHVIEQGELVDRWKVRARNRLY